jgi:hypothetical protein
MRRGMSIEERFALQVPGSIAKGTVRLENQGSIPWSYSLASKGGSGPLCMDSINHLRLAVRQGPDNKLFYSGPISSMTPRLGEIDAEAHADLRLLVMLPIDAPNTYRGRRVTIDFVWNVQSTS